MTDEEMIKALHQWPHWPLLALKRPREQGQWPEFAVLVDRSPLSAYEPTRLELYVGANIFNPATLVEHTSVTVEEIVAQGWLVD